MKIKKISFSKWINSIAVILMIFMLNACFSPFQGKESTLIINLGGGNGRSAIPWPTENSDIFDDIIYVILLSGNGDTKILNANGSDKITVAVSPGFWDIDVTAYYKTENFLYGNGSDRVQVRTGETNTANVKMEKKYFKIGETGPGGGIIFYVADGMDNRDFGFTMTDTGTTAYYLEAAPEDWYDGTSDPQLAWAAYPSSSYIDVPDTEREIGTGRKNTSLMLASENVPAAEACNAYSSNDKADWFLPSIDELIMLYENREYVGNFYYGDYYSSSQSNNAGSLASVYIKGFINGMEGIYGKDYGCRIRPIRAF